MKLTIDNNGRSYEIEGTTSEISSLLQSLISESGNKSSSEISIKNKKFEKPVSSGLNKNNMSYISSMFTYPMSNKTSVGKPAYLAAIMLDGKPHTVAELTKLGNCTTHSINTVISRLLQTGSTVEVSTKTLTPMTIVQVTKIVQKDFQPIKRQVKVKNPPALNFKNLVI